MLNRRSLITGLISFAAAPAIVKIENIMPVKAFELPDFRYIKILDKYSKNSIYGKFAARLYYDKASRTLIREFINYEDFYI